MKMIPGSRRCHYAARVGVFLVMAALIAGMAGCYGNHYLPPCGSQNLEIRTWYDLAAVRGNLCGNHTLMNDLDSSTSGYEELAGPMAHGGSGWTPIGSSFTEVKSPFKGTFDGQGYEIRDLFIHDSDPSPFYELGLFGLSYGIIRDIGVVNATVVGVTGYPVGALVGVNAFGGTVSNSYSTGNVSGYDKYGTVGGLIGENWATVSDSYSTASVTGNGVVGGLVGENTGTVSNSYFTGNVTGGYFVGGLVYRNRGTVSNCYSTGNVTGYVNVGGLVGWNQGTVSNCYSTGNVTGYVNVGGLVEWNQGTVSNSFWDTETSGQSTSDGGTGKTTTEMKSIATFSVAGWNIIAVALNETNPAYIWNIVNNVTYPFLGWQS